MTENFRKLRRKTLARGGKIETSNKPFFNEICVRTRRGLVKYIVRGGAVAAGYLSPLEQQRNVANYEEKHLLFLGFWGIMYLPYVRIREKYDPKTRFFGT